MNTTILFNVDKKVKIAAKKKAEKQGLTLSAVLNSALRNYVASPTEKVDPLARDIAKARAQRSVSEAKARRSLGITDAALKRDIAKARKQVREGKFVTEAELRKQLGI